MKILSILILMSFISCAHQASSQRSVAQSNKFYQELIKDKKLSKEKLDYKILKRYLVKNEESIDSSFDLERELGFVSDVLYQTSTESSERVIQILVKDPDQSKPVKEFVVEVELDNKRGVHNLKTKNNLKKFTLSKLVLMELKGYEIEYKAAE